MTKTSDGGVRKAIGKHSIKEGSGVIDGKIIPAVASIEWGKEIYLYSDGSPLIKKSDVEVTDEVLITPKSGELETEVGIDEDMSDVYTGDEDVINTAAERDEFFKDIKDGITKIEAERIWAVTRARKMRRELQKLEGTLVDKGLVYKNLFEFASVIRDTMINIPDRVIDNIRAAEDRNEAHGILMEEILDALKGLAGIGDVKLNNED